MSSMLEQAIVDAAALREAALKNAEQSLIEKYAPQIKEAVDSLLDKDVLEEQEVGQIATSGQVESEVVAPFAASPTTDSSQEVTLTMSDDDQVYEFDLDVIKQQAKDKDVEAGEQEDTADLMGDLGLDMPSDQPEGDTDVDALLESLSEVLEESDELLEEEVVAEMSGLHKNGTFETNEATLEYQHEMQKAIEEIEGLEEENDDLKEENQKLQETVSSIAAKNKKLLQIINKLDSSVNEALLSNAKLLYSNKTLSDASLNERQKSKIVEAIAKAKTPKEAKNLHEALKTTVGTTKNDGPKSLRESVSRKSNLSGIMPRKQKPQQEFSFADQMKKLAGIK